MWKNTAWWNFGELLSLSTDLGGPMVWFRMRPLPVRSPGEASHSKEVTCPDQVVCSLHPQTSWSVMFSPGNRDHKTRYFHMEHTDTPNYNAVLSIVKANKHVYAKMPPIAFRWITSRQVFIGLQPQSVMIGFWIFTQDRKWNKILQSDPKHDYSEPSRCVTHRVIES